MYRHKCQRSQCKSSDALYDILIIFFVYVNKEQDLKDQRVVRPVYLHMMSLRYANKRHKIVCGGGEERLLQNLPKEMKVPSDQQKQTT